MQTACAQCGKPLERSLSQLAKTHRSFCSAACRIQYFRTGKTVTCGWCGIEFYKPRSRLTQENLCSAHCRNRWLGRQNIEIRNVPGHSKGHKAPHLSELNRQRNPYGRMQSRKTKSTASSVYRQIATEMLGRELRGDEVVHHINGDRSDNRPENLAVLSRRSITVCTCTLPAAVMRQPKEVMPHVKGRSSLARSRSFDGVTWAQAKQSPASPLPVLCTKPEK